MLDTELPYRHYSGMLQTIFEMQERGDHDALNDVWKLLGGESTLPRSHGAELVAALIHRLCGKARNRYAAERDALDDLARTVEVDSDRFAQVDDLEDAIVEALGERLQEKLDDMPEEKRRAFFEDMVKRMSDEDRLRLIEQVLEGYDQMSDEEKAAFRRRLASELDVTEGELAGAIAGGAATLIPLLVAKQTGFAIFLWTTNVMAATASSVGLTIPFAVYMLKNRALGWLLGPVGMLVTTAMSAGWFVVKAWRRKERFRKLVQVVAYCSAWRDANRDDGE